MYNNSGMRPPMGVPMGVPMVVNQGGNYPRGGGVLEQNPMMMAWLNRLANRRREIDETVEAPEAQTAQQPSQSRVVQDDQGNWYYRGAGGEWVKTSVIHNPQTGMRFYWDNDARDYVPAE